MSALGARAWRLCLSGAVVDPVERHVDVNGMRLRVTEAGERGAPVVLLVHGFRDLAYAWRRQVPALADAGFHVLAPDQRGYGGLSRPRRAPTAALRRTFVGHFFYMLHFQAPGVADAEMNRDPATTLRRITSATDPGDAALLEFLSAVRPNL